MFDSNDSGQECSVAQHRENDDDGCPKCGGPIQYVETRGPGDVRVQPCGHRISQVLARNFPRADDGLRADGGTPPTTEAAADAARDLLDIPEVSGEFDVSVNNTTNGESVSITPPPGTGLTDRVLSRLKTECGLHLRNVFPAASMQFTATFHPTGGDSSAAVDEEVNN
ncbi:hypothetical protein [Halobacterium zhouii]|uniref:hypothetical protein n=1 Tax=Halobacterium zhouii TaxID=2902624 RepID=UPI001E5CA84C|nr:hypothetical protein [Halobacterium zhouii]